MTLVNLVGTGPWYPYIPGGIVNTNAFAAADNMLLDADEEEAHFVGSVTIDGGGSKTFGTSGSKISWLPGTPITFAAGSTLTVGIKKTPTTGNPVHGTPGAGAFDVYKALVGGTDTITQTAWRDDAMASGTPFTMNDGDFIAICFHLDTTSGTPAVRVRATGIVATNLNQPCATLLTSAGTVFTAQSLAANCIITFDDGTLGWITPTLPFSVADVASATIGSGNIFGNIFRFPFPCKIDAIAAVTTPSGGAADFALELYSTPLGTPALVESIPIVAAQISGGATVRLTIRRLTVPRTLAANTDYCVGVKQATANAVTVHQTDISNANYFKPYGMGAESYAVTSTGGATFASINAGRRRYRIWARISALDDGTGAGGGMLRYPGVNGGLIG